MRTVSLRRPKTAALLHNNGSLTYSSIGRRKVM
jgi:hypothetical protein